MRCEKCNQVLREKGRKSERYQIIINAIDGETTWSQILERSIRDGLPALQVSAYLTRLLSDGALIRVKKGVYKLGETWNK